MEWEPTQTNLEACQEVFRVRKVVFNYPSHVEMPSDATIALIHAQWLREVPGCVDIQYANLGPCDVLTIGDEGSDYSNDDIKAIIAMVVARFWTHAQMRG